VSKVVSGAAAVPAPAAARDDIQDEPVEHGLPEGETAVAIALVQRAQAGDSDAFGELYDRYVDQVYRYIAYRVASKQVAEDLTSETFLRALRRIGTFTWQGRDVGAWFTTIARNLVADHYKSGRYRLELTTDDIGESGGVPQLVEGPEGVVLEAMTNKVLLEVIKQLNPEQQECIALRFLQGMSVSETAQVMGKNEGAIKALQYRAIRTLGRLLPEGVEL
jgi:RNA polymerase sigma-70 factor, ECF subfamily